MLRRVPYRRLSHRQRGYARLVRVYVPATLAMLQRLVADRSLHARSGTAFAVTPTLREAYAEGDDDELAEVALRDAALASLRLLGWRGRRRAAASACRAGGRGRRT